MSVPTIISRVQTLYEDPDGSNGIDTDYVQGFLAIHNEDVEACLESYDLSYDTVVVVLPNVPAGTADLSSYQADGQPLGNMMLPTALEWRLVGQDDTQWQPIPEVDKVVDVEEGPNGVSDIEGIQSYEWRGGIVKMSPSSVATDIRVRCEVLPALLDSNSAVYIKGLTNVLVWGVCAMIAFVRGGPDSKKGQWFQAKADKAFDDVVDRMVKQEQNVPRQMAGRRSMLNMPTWRMPFSSGMN